MTRRLHVKALVWDACGRCVLGGCSPAVSLRGSSWHLGPPCRTGPASRAEALRGLLDPVKLLTDAHGPSTTDCRRICSLWSQQASLRPGRRYLGRHPGRGRAVHILGRHAAQVLTPASCVSPSSPRADNSQPTAPGWLALSAACGSSLSRHIRTVGTPSYWVGHRFECDWLLSGVLPCQRPVASVIWVALLYKGRAQRAYVARA